MDSLEQRGQKLKPATRATEPSTRIRKRPSRQTSDPGDRGPRRDLLATASCRAHGIRTCEHPPACKTLLNRKEIAACAEPLISRKTWPSGSSGGGQDRQARPGPKGSEHAGAPMACGGAAVRKRPFVAVARSYRDDQAAGGSPHDWHRPERGWPSHRLRRWALRLRGTKTPPELPLGLTERSQPALIAFFNSPYGSVIAPERP